MVSTKNFLALLFIFSIIGTGLVSCDSGQNQTTTTTPATTEQPNDTQDVPEGSDGEPMTKPVEVPTPTPSVTPTPEIVPPVLTPTPSIPTTKPAIPDLSGATPAPDNSGYQSVPKDTPLLPNQGNVEPDGKGGILAPLPETMPEAKKPEPKPKADSKTSAQAKANASTARKAMFAKALATIPSSKEPKFQEYYKKLDALVTKIEGQKPLTQESIDAVNKLNLQYPAEASKFNDAMQKVLPNQRGG